MNAPLSPLTPPRRLTAADVMFLVENGLIDPHARFELMDGAIIPMSPKGRFHEVARERIELWLDQPWRKAFNVLREHTLALDGETIVEPDFILYDGARRIADAPLTGADIRLIIEVADTSWSYDTGVKAEKYARFGVAEYWVVHAVNRTAKTFREPGPQGYRAVAQFGADDSIAPLCASGASFKL
ncbi:MAG TPA: Uma2 family endonuclease [Caulobacterales bacterium]|nr:Uma2 family endonuclease [Caulobacterales bacterium]